MKHRDYSHKRGAPDRQRPDRWHALYLLVCLFLTGASTLILEIVGARVISPFYGSSLYAWSALITVTLVALAAGYFFGGRLADKGASLTLFARILFLAGLTVAVVPLLRISALTATAPLGIQMGAVMSAAILIAPSLLLLSLLGPLAIKLQANSLACVGQSAGNVYALSTIGSVLGAALAAFVLVPHAPVSHIFYGTACLILLLAAWGQYLSRLKVPWTELATAAAVFVFAVQARGVPRDGLLVNRESPYGQIKVLDYEDQRYLLVNGTTQSLAKRKTLESDSPYINALEWTALSRSGAKRALVIGIGAGMLPKALERHHKITTDTVDIDRAVVETARDYFDFKPRGDVFLEDGRVVLERSAGRYDIVVLDAFSAESPPFHLFTVEAFAAMRRAVAPDGIVAVNLVSHINGPEGRPWQSVYKTLQSVFPEVRAYLGNQQFQGMGNVLFFASTSPLPRAPASPAREAIRDDLDFMLRGELLPSRAELARAKVLTDDYAPLEHLLGSTAVLWRRVLQESLDSILLL